MSARPRLLLVVLLLASGAARAEPAPEIEVRVVIDRPQVFLHEQAVLSVVVHHPTEARASWEPPPFDGFWAERLGTRGLPADAQGRARTEFRRALFATRTGELEIADSKLVLAGEGGEEREVHVPGARLRVVPLPDGVPADTLVGRLEVRVVIGDERVRLGKALSLTVELAGEGNVWDATPPALEPLVGPDVEVFPEAPLVSIGESSGRATTRRTFRYALVPARAGPMRIEPVRFAYFDPRAGELTSAESAAQAYSVFAGSSADAEERAPWQNRSGKREARQLPLGWLAGIVAAALGSSLLYLAYRRRAQRTRARADGAPSPRAAFDAALAARDTAECLPLLARAVRVGIRARHGFDALALTSAEIAARSPDPEALALLLALDRARFAGQSRADDALLARVREYLKV